MRDLWVDCSAICSPAFAAYDRVTRRTQIIKIDPEICFWTPWLVKLRQKRLVLTKKLKKIENSLILLVFIGNHSPLSSPTLWWKNNLDCFDRKVSISPNWNLETLYLRSNFKSSQYGQVDCRTAAKTNCSNKQSKNKWNLPENNDVKKIKVWDWKSWHGSITWVRSSLWRLDGEIPTFRDQASYPRLFAI